MMKPLNIWECECGKIEHKEFPPEECGKCWKRNSFNEVPEDMKEELEDQVIEKLRPNMEDYE